MKVDVVLCKDCWKQHTEYCPMYFEEEYTWDDDGYIESDIDIHDYSRDEGYCDRGEWHYDN